MRTAKQVLGQFRVSEADLNKGPALDIDAALKELGEKDELQLEIETGYKWASRSIAAFQMAMKAEGQERFRLLDWGDDLRHEALEHAALACDEGKLVGELQRAIDKVRAEALK